MGIKSLLRVGYVVMVVQGLLSVLVPKKAIKLGTVGWRAGYENVGDLEPRDWYVEVTRVLGVGMLAAGLTGLLVTEAENRGAASTVEEEGAADEFDFEEDTEDEDDDDGPVTVDIEDDE
jgi:hypothetical protein